METHPVAVAASRVRVPAFRPNIENKVKPSGECGPWDQKELEKTESVFAIRASHKCCYQ